MISRPVRGKARHRVYLDAFSIDKYETTNALYKRFMGATSPSSSSAARVTMRCRAIAER
jgi:formylglycine-generating enzyme required for sulfatase activity